MATNVARALFCCLLVTACSGPSAPAAPQPSATPPGPTASGTPASNPSPSPRPTATIATPEPSREAAWTAGPNMITPHAHHTATLLRDGRVLITGGLIQDRLDGRVSPAAELYDPDDESWSETAAMLQPRWGHEATLLDDGIVLVTGGLVNSAESLRSAATYDPSSGMWTATRGMEQGRGDHTSTLLADGTVLVAGGSTLSAPDGISAAERYDPVRRSWTDLPRLRVARQGHTATLLADGRVLVVGGGGEVRLAEGPPYSATAEVFDPTTGRWTATGSMVNARAGHTAVLLGDGRVLVAGGSMSDDATAQSAELYDPATGRWSGSGSMGGARSGHTATALLDGSVLVVGGFGVGSDPPILATAELYDPIAGTWVMAPSLATARTSHTATRLVDGRVLVLGDFDHESERRVDIFDPGGPRPAS